MKPLEEQLKADGKWVDNPTAEQVNTMFRTLPPLLSDTTAKGRKRRTGQLSWTTYLRQREPKKKRP